MMPRGNSGSRSPHQSGVEKQQRGRQQGSGSAGFGAVGGSGGSSYGTPGGDESEPMDWQPSAPQGSGRSAMRDVSNFNIGGRGPYTDSTRGNPFGQTQETSPLSPFLEPSPTRRGSTGTSRFFPDNNDPSNDLGLGSSGFSRPNVGSSGHSSSNLTSGFGAAATGSISSADFLAATSPGPSHPRMGVSSLPGAAAATTSHTGFGTKVSRDEFLKRMGPRRKISTESNFRFPPTSSSFPDFSSSSSANVTGTASARDENQQTSTLGLTGLHAAIAAQPTAGLDTFSGANNSSSPFSSTGLSQQVAATHGSNQLGAFGFPSNELSRRSSFGPGRPPRTISNESQQTSSLGLTELHEQLPRTTAIGRPTPQRQSENLHLRTASLSRGPSPTERSALRLGPQPKRPTSLTRYELSRKRPENVSGLEQHKEQQTWYGGNDQDTLNETDEQRARRREQGITMGKLGYPMKPLRMLSDPTFAKFKKYPAFQLPYLQTGDNDTQFPRGRPDESWTADMLCRHIIPQDASLLGQFPTFRENGAMPGFNFNSLHNDYSGDLGFEYETFVDRPPPLRIIPLNSPSAKILSLKMLPRFVFPECSALVFPPDMARTGIDKGRIHMFPPGYYRPLLQAGSTRRHCTSQGAVRVTAEGEEWRIFNVKKGFFWYRKKLMIIEEDVQIVTRTPPRRMRLMALYVQAMASNDQGIQQMAPFLNYKALNQEAGLQYKNLPDECKRAILNIINYKPEVVSICQAQFRCSMTKILRLYVRVFAVWFIGYVRRHGDNIRDIRDHVEAFETFKYAFTRANGGIYLGPVDPLATVRTHPSSRQRGQAAAARGYGSPQLTPGWNDIRWPPYEPRWEASRMAPGFPNSAAGRRTQAPGEMLPSSNQIALERRGHSPLPIPGDNEGLTFAGQSRERGPINERDNYGRRMDNSRYLPPVVRTYEHPNLVESNRNREQARNQQQATEDLDATIRADLFRRGNPWR